MNRFSVLITCVLAVAALWVGAWLFGAEQIRLAYAQTKADLATQGTVLDCDKLSIDGMPFRYDVECLNLTIAANDTTITLPAIATSVRVFQPTHAVTFAKGPLEIVDEFWGSKRTISWESAELSARTNGLALARISMVVKNLKLTDDLVGEKTIASASQFQAHIVDAPDFYDAANKLATWATFASFSNLSLPDIEISDAAFRFETDFAGLPDDLRNLDLRTIATNWQSLNNPINIHIVEGVDAQSSFEILGKLALDENYKWQGDFDLTTNGLAQRISAFVPPALATVYLGDENADGSLYRAYSIRHGVLFAGNTPLTALPPML